MLIKISLNLSGRILAAIWAVSLNCIPVHLFLSTKSVPIKKSHRVINSLFFLPLAELNTWNDNETLVQLNTSCKVT